MGIISRFADIMSANINALLDKAEDPGKMVDQTLRKLNEDLAAVKKETANVMAEEKGAERRLRDAQAEVTKWHDYAKKALSSGKATAEADAREFLAREAKAQQAANECEQVYKVAKDNADKMRAMHDKLVNDIATLNSRRDTIKAKAAVAKAQTTVNKATSNMNSSTTMAGFDRMEERVNKQLDAALAEAELNAKPRDAAEDLAAQYDSAPTGAGVDDALAKLKAEMGI